MFENGKISVIRSSTQVLVKVVLFQLWGRGHPQGDASLNFFLEFKGFLLGLSNEDLLRKVFKNNKNLLLKQGLWYKQANVLMTPPPSLFRVKIVLVFSNFGSK